MTLRIHNTLTRETERLLPIEPGHVRLYVCGITIYDLCHMGHARFMIAFDVVQRWLKTVGHRVTYVRNITDIDDKIIRRALERGISIRALTDEMIEALQQDTDALGLERPTHQPRATQYVPQMIEMIATLEKKRLRLPKHERRRQLRGAQVPGLRQALGEVDRPAARRRASTGTIPVPPRSARR
jgi:cysteinyl-tRNA synthetase